MTARTKSALIIGATLLVGIVLGGLGAGAIISSRVEEFRGLRGPRPLHDVVDEVIRPTDEAQRRRIQTVFDNTRARHDRLREATIRHHDAIFDTLSMELDTILTSEQKTRFEEWWRRDREHHRPPPEGPPPGGPHDGDGRPPDRRPPPPDDERRP